MRSEISCSIAITSARSLISLLDHATITGGWRVDSGSNQPDWRGRNGSTTPLISFSPDGRWLNLSRGMA